VNSTLNTQTQTYFRTEVTAVADEARDMIEGGVMILFSPPCPPALGDISVLHKPVQPLERTPQVGDVLKVGAETAELISVGEIAGNNLKELGHVVVYFNKAPGDKILPGALHVAAALTAPAPGDVIELVGASDGGSR
jgi:PTS system glucitol/sorbitol-specific IIA component